jgi:hypothetical protein
MKHKNSSFWLGDDFYEDQIDILTGESSEKRKGKDPVKLAGYRRAIGNFVRIVTGEDIPVRYTKSGDSYTDGDVVTISASLKDKDFDPAVGLALHEGSHVKLTDFSVLGDLDNWIQRHDQVMEALAEKHETIESRWEASDYVKPILTDLLNVIEDRRIDAWVYKNAPGYQGYYASLYDKYFNAKVIDKGLKSDEYTSYEWDSYMFRIVNLTNPNRRLDVMNMATIWKMIDLANISRLKSTLDALELAWNVFNCCEQHIPAMKKPVVNKPKDGEQSAEEETSNVSDQAGNGDKFDDSGNMPSDDGSKAEGDEAMKGTGDQEGNNEMPQDLDLLSDRLKDQLEKAIEKQKKFQKGEIKKTGVSRKMLDQIQSMEESGVEIKSVEYEQERYAGTYYRKTANVTVIKNLTKRLIETVESGMWNSWYNNDMPVKDGIRKGIMLGKKLKVRSEERNTKFNRLRSGKIDKRMIANAGYGAEAIFEKIESFAYNPGIIHISIDNSGSMSGRNFRNAMTTAVAIAKACDMIENMDCVISLRAGSSFGNTSGYGTAVMLIAYDSRKHGMAHIKTCFPMLCVSGSTPEGLCFDAVMNEIVDSSRGKDAYFVNMSDGCPYFDGYYGEGAYTHTRAQVKKMVREGIKVISYFIADGRSWGRDKENFQKMYGKEAQFIDTSKITEVAKTMNSKFLEV